MYKITRKTVALLVAICLCFLGGPVFAASPTDEAVLGNDRWSVDSSGDFVPNANTYSIGSETQYPASIWVGGAEYSSFAAGTDGNWTDNGLTVTLDGAPTKFIATKSSGDMAATGFTVGTGDITFANGQKIDGDTNNEIRLIENSDTLKIGFSGDDITLDTTDGGVIFALTDATDGTVDFMTNNDADDYIQISTTAHQPLINFVGCNGSITADSGAISFGNENLSTTGTLSSGATTVTSLIIGDETFSVPTDDTIRVASNDAQTIFQIYTAATNDEDAVLLLSADASEDNGDDWQIVSDGGTNSLLFQNDATGSQVTYLTLSNVGAITTTGDIVMTGTTPMLTIGDAGAEDTMILFDGNAQDFHIGLDDTADDLIIGLGSALGTTPIISMTDTGVTTITGSSHQSLTVWSANATNGTAALNLVGDVQADEGDSWQILNDATGTLLIGNDSAEAGTYVTKFTLEGADGDITTTGDVEILDDMDLVFGTDADWKVQYDEGVDNQLLFITAGTGCTATTDPMFEILVGASPTADQQVFGIGKGTQASNTALFTVDEDGDAVVTGSTTMTGGMIIAPVAVTDAGTYTILAANSGKLHMMPNLTADCTLTLPTAAAGLNYRFVYGGAAADVQDWTFDTGADANFYYGGLVGHDTDDGDVLVVYADGDSNSKVKIDTPAAGTFVELYCDGTRWIINGHIISATDTHSAFSNQA
jgi:hypothetical protein